MITKQVREAAALRAARAEGTDGADALNVYRKAAPEGTARMVPFTMSECRAKKIEKDGRTFYQLEGYASVVETPYEMYDWAGPYNEVVSRDAFEVTLSRAPDVSYLVNHKGVTMARTTSGSLELSSDDNGLFTRAFLNPQRTDVRDLVAAIEDRDITEMSFAFLIDRGIWSPDYTEYRIEQVDLDRGDVSAVNYGANPYTSVAARSREILSDLKRLPAGAQREALSLLETAGASRAGSVQPTTVDAPAVKAELTEQTNERSGQALELVKSRLHVLKEM